MKPTRDADATKYLDAEAAAMSVPLVVDLFAGAGGASLGIERALGRSPDIAVNHSAAAIEMHQRNHPATRHFAADVYEVDPAATVAGRPVALLWASPDCRHFSRAKGGKPVSKQVRSLAWVVVDWAAAVAPRLIVLENVGEFQTWGPLDEDGRPIKARSGETFAEFVGQLRAIGYDVDWRILNAADYGAPTHRRRLFLIARRDGAPIRWPVPSHGPKRAAVWRTAAECIDWSLPCPSIFDRKKPLAEATCRRIAEGIRRFVLDDPAPFIVKFRFDSAGSPIDAPMPTVTAGSFQKRPGGAAHALGLCVPTIIGVGGRSGQSPPTAGDAPVGTITGKNDRALCTPVLVRTAHGDVGKDGKRRGRGSHDVSEPLPTVLGSNDYAVVAPTLIQTGYGEREGQAPRVPGLGKPLGAAVAGGTKHALVSAFLAKHYGGAVGHVLERPLGTVTAVDHHSLVAATLVANNTNNEPRRATDPLGVVTTGNRHYLVASFLTRYFGAGIGRKPTDPAPTATAENKTGLVTVTLDGQDYVIADIGLRMLQPLELARAQGFPDSYELIGTKDKQVRLIGNSVCPPVAEAVLRANVEGSGEDGAPQIDLFADALDDSARVAARAGR
jgi:DNA (cytosine-5)-methyltransferase 1